jgi:hypothetical protein
MNNNNKNKIFTPQKALEILNKAYDMIVNQNKYQMKNNKQPIDLNTKKSLYDGFYAGFILLMDLPDLPDYIKHDLVVKKSIIDGKYSRNIKYREFNKLKIHKKITNNMIEDKNLQNNHIKYLNNLRLKEKISELSNIEKRVLYSNIK